MNIKIVTDSCCDLPKDMLNQVEIVPLTISIDGKHYKDGVDLSRDEFYTRLAGCKNLLNIKFIMGNTPEGEIELFEKVRGSHRVFNKLLDLICKHGSNFEDKILGIAHGNCLQKAKQFKEEVEKRYNFKEIIITQIGPTIAAYASEGALLISF